MKPAVIQVVAAHQRDCTFHVRHAERACTTALYASLAGARSTSVIIGARILEQQRFFAFGSE
jgi:hypothetical protein